jgi:hypothetical protein
MTEGVAQGRRPVLCARGARAQPFPAAAQDPALPPTSGTPEGHLTVNELGGPRIEKGAGRAAVSERAKGLQEDWQLRLTGARSAQVCL